MFGNLNKSTFGAAAPNTSFGFGANTTNTANPFGQNQTLFGKPATGGFGTPSTSTFGQPQQNTMFAGAQPPQNNMFQNANTSFGTVPTTQSSFGGGLFGQQPSTSSGLFGSTSTFGQQTKPAGFGFGQTQNQPVLFGQQPQAQQASTLFQPQANTLFGTSTSGFGSQQTGTVIKFTPVTGTDTMMKNGVSQGINTKHHSITCMKEYESKSFEELRCEDYQVNRKGPQQSTGFGATPFGATASTAPSLFGAAEQNKPAFGQATGFGQTTSTFGQPTSTGFGIGAQQNTMGGGGLFSKPGGFGAPTSSTATTGFGFGTTTQNTGGLFGSNTANKPFNTTAQPLFGAPTTQVGQTGFGTTPSLFGNAQQQNTTTGLFGKPAQPTTGFGTLGQSTGFSFNQPASTAASSLFTQNKSLFGQTNTSTPSFGTTNTFGQNSTVNFGALNKPAFGGVNQIGFGNTLGGQQQGTGLFGNTAPKPDGLFGNTGTGLFGNTSNTMFGTNNALTFDNNAQQNSLFPQGQSQSEQRNLAALTNDPFGDAPHLAGLEPKARTDPHPSVATNPAELKSLIDSSKKVDMTQGSKLKVIPKIRKDSLFEGLSKSDTESNTPEYHKTSVRRLVVKQKVPENTKMLREEVFNIFSPENNNSQNNSNGSDTKELTGKNDNSSGKRLTPSLKLSFDSTLQDDLHNNSSLKNSNMSGNSLFNASNLSAKNSSVLVQEDIVEEDGKDPLASGDSESKHPTGISSTRPEYYTLPDLNDLIQYIDEKGACVVKGFTIGRKGYGNVYYPDEMDVSGLNLDQLVQFRYREINIYPDESKKPPVGQGLNRRAQVTLDNVFPRRSGTNTLLTDPMELVQMNFAEKLRKITVKKNAKFVDYRPETGSWVFKVEHFSKYGFNDSDEETDASNGEKKKEPSVPKQLDRDTSKELMKMVGLQQVEKEKQKIKNLEEIKAVTKYGLDNDILIDEDQDEGDDVLQQSMFVDLSEDNYHEIPTDVPMHAVPFDTYKTNRNIQVMKSTLFAEDDRSSDASSHVSIIRQYLDIPEEQILPPIHEEIVAKKRPVLRPKVDKVYNYGGSEISPKISTNRSYLDISVFKGKSFNVGWGKGFNFVNLRNASMKSFNVINLKSAQDKYGDLSTNMIQFRDSEKFDPLNEFLIDTLKIVLQESTHDLSQESVPTFKIRKGHDYLLKQTELFEKLCLKYNTADSQYLHSIWTLCSALWGPGENTAYHRRYLLSEWLKTITNNVEEYNKSISVLSNDLKVEKIFNLLSVFKIFEAANLAMENKFPHLSLIISQLSVTNRTKGFLQEQIETWYNSMAAQHITDSMKKIYLLLAGIPSKDTVNIFEGLDWRRSFAMHLWYVVPNGASIEMAIEMYKDAFAEVGYSERPLPPYCGKFVEEHSFDVLYHILLLYKSRIHRLSSVLNPATHTNDLLDYRLSWLLLQLFLSLDVGLVDSSETIKFCTSFSNQLENLGHWEWAIFALLFIEDNIVKKKLIMEVLDRNLSPDADKAALDTQNNLVNNMKVPAKWIHLVKGEKTLLLGRNFEAFNHFALAEEYSKANDIFVAHILPGLFINEQYDLLRMFIDAILPGAKDILKWNHEVGLVNEFLELQDRVITFKQDEMFKLQIKLQSISERLSFFPLKTDQQKLCIAEMSKRCSWIYKELYKKSKTNILSSSFSHFIDSLVMPPDFKQNEALYLINEFDNFRLIKQ